MQLAIDDWHLPRKEVEYVNAYNQVMAEYKDYYLNHCVAPPPVTPDPVLDSTKVPPVTTTTTPPAGNSDGLTPGVTNTTAAAEKPQLIKGIPNLALWIAGGLVALTTIVLIVKKKS